jgi:hypothetical protein
MEERPAARRRQERRIENLDSDVKCAGRGEQIYRG